MQKNTFVWQGENWSKVHISNESKFNLIASDGRQFARHHKGDRLKPKCVKKSLEREVVWRTFSSEGVGPIVGINGTLNAMYLNLVKQHDVPFLQVFPDRLVNSVKLNIHFHTAKQAKEVKIVQTMS